MEGDIDVDIFEVMDFGSANEHLINHGFHSNPKFIFLQR